MRVGVHLETVLNRTKKDVFSLRNLKLTCEDLAFLTGLGFEQRCRQHAEDEHQETTSDFQHFVEV